MTRISQARLLATAIHLRDDLSPKQKSALLTRWEKVSFRIYGMLAHDARTRVGEYVRLAWRILNEDLPARDIDEAIGEIGQDFSMADAIKQLTHDNCYVGWENELRLAHRNRSSTFGPRVRLLRNPNTGSEILCYSLPN